MDNDEDDVQKLTELTGSTNDQVLDFPTEVQMDFNDFINFDDNCEDLSSDAESESEEDITNPPKHPQTTLTEYESSLINSCADPELKKLLMLNRTKNLQLAQVHKKIRDLLIKTQNDIWGEEMKLRKGDPKPVHTSVWKLACPYFKDKQFFSCPSNLDVQRKKNANELTLYDLQTNRKWNKLDLMNLKGAIIRDYNAHIVMVKAKKITAVKQLLGSNEETDKVAKEEIAELEREVSELKGARATELPPLSGDKLINWDKVSEVFMKDKRSPSECQAVWRLYMHPSLNNSSWSPEENDKLEHLVREHSQQNWESIAEELGNGRSSFATCLHYFTNICDKLKKNKFSPEEDKLLMEIVDCYKIGSHVPWQKVVRHFANSRSRHQLYHRYTYFLSQSHVKKGRFSEAEDVLLMILVDKFGKDFRKCAELMPHRSQMQLKSRYCANLERRIKKGTFTQWDDEEIFNHVAENGEGSWGQLIEKLGRCRGQIRQRYLTIKRFLATHPNTTIKDIPRRKHAYKVDERYNFLMFMVNQFKNCEIPTLSVIEDALEIKSKTPMSKFKQTGLKGKRDAIVPPVVKNIDSMLVDFFSNTLKVSHQKCVTSRHLDEAASNVSEVLSILGAKLEIPKNFEDDSRLDDVDKAILGKIKDKTINNNEITTFVPPNINTLVGLRSLLIKHKSSRRPLKKDESKTVCGMEQKLMNVNQEIRDEVLADRELFTKRFNALFHWGSVLSLEKPNNLNLEEEPSTSNTSSSQQIEVQPLKTFSRKAKTGPDPVPLEKNKPTRTSKRKIDNTAEIAAKKQKVEITLKPVDRSIVEKLKKQKQINITRIETVTGTDGVIRGLRDCDTESLGEEVNSDVVRESPDLENAELLCDDLEDLRKLDVFMKTEIEEQPNRSNLEQYEVLQDDIQLLDELLTYDSIKC